jgi:hypothetical protein
VEEIYEPKTLTEPSGTSVTTWNPDRLSNALKSYEGLDGFYKHESVDHAEMYVFCDVHTNCMENFWCLLKRSLKETYTKIDP